MPSVPFVPAPNVLMVEYRFLVNSQQMENVMYFRKQDLSTIVSAEATALLDTLAATWVSDAASLTCTDAVLKELYATDLTTDLSPTYAVSVDEAGTGSGAVMPGNVTVTTGFRTAGRGKSSRGRNYWVGMPSGAFDGDVVNSTWLANSILYYLAVRDAIDAMDTSWAHVLVSRRSEGQWREVAYVQAVTSYFHADNLSDSQRRRLTGRGR